MMKENVMIAKIGRDAIPAATAHAPGRGKATIYSRNRDTGELSPVKEVEVYNLDSEVVAATALVMISRDRSKWFVSWEQC